MTTIRMLATDLDGTLLRSDRTISPRTARAMAGARGAGIDVVWATARARHSVHEFAQSSGFRGIAVCANGAVVVDLADGIPRIVSTIGIDTDIARSAIETVREVVPGTVFAAVGPTRFVAEAGYARACVFSDHHRDPDAMDLADSAFPVSPEPIVKVVARHPSVSSVDLYRRASEVSVAGVELTHSGAPYLEMAALGVSKASALAALCAERGIDVQEVAAAGDARNDIAMLEWAGTALCPSNAIAEVQVLADRILPHHDDDGVASYLEELTALRRSPVT